jgi:hypothetical protein
MMAATNWRDLILWDAEGNRGSTLGSYLDRAEPHEAARITPDTDGAAREWFGFFLAAEGEEPAWESPRRLVDWSGFREAVEVRRRG